MKGDIKMVAETMRARYYLNYCRAQGPLQHDSRYFMSVYMYMFRFTYLHLYVASEKLTGNIPKYSVTFNFFIF